MQGEKCPCKECEERYAGCHGKCPEYTEWKKSHDEILKSRSAHVRELNDIIGTEDQIKKMYHRRQRHAPKHGKRFED